MAYYPDSIIIEFYNGTTWVDISAYVVLDINGFSGHSTNSPIDRVASLGTLELTLDNRDKLFTPYGGDSLRGLSTLTGFNKGARIRLRVVAGIHNKVIWIGRIDSIKSDDGLWGEQRVHVFCVDWMDILSKFKMKSSSILLNKRINESIDNILSRVSIKPEAVNYDTGNNIFPAVFDNVKEKTKAMSEVNKLTLSELGYTYLLMDGTLRVENSSARRGTDPLDQIPTVDEIYLLSDDTNLLFDDTINLLLADYNYENSPLELAAKELTIDLNNSDLTNIGHITAYPTKTDTSLVVVYSIGKSIPIASGQTIGFTGYYTDPAGGSAINATNQQTPVITTDYLSNTLSDGSGTDISADLVVNATYWGDSIDYVITNNNASAGFITKLQARGYGIYRYNLIQSETEDTSSTASYGESIIDIDQKYKTDLYAGKRFVESMIEKYSKPKSRITQIEFDANINSSHLMSFMYLDIGNKIRIYDNRSQITEDYYIVNKKFKIMLDKVISCVFTLIVCSSFLSGQLTPLTLKFNSSGTTSGINFGFIPQLQNLTKRTTAFWIYPTSNPATSKVIALYDGITLGISTTDLKAFYYRIMTGNTGIWTTPANSITLNAWNHVVFTHDTNTNPLSTPLIYINGVLQTLTETGTPTGTTKSDVYDPLVVGNAYSFTFPYYGFIKDARVYNTVLTSGEITDLYNSGVQSYSKKTDNLMFQSFFVHKDEGDATSLDGVTLSTQGILDNIYYTVGTLNSTVIVDEP